MQKFAAAALLSFSLVAGGVQAAGDHPKLTVVVSIDQMRADYLQRFGPYFAEGGFKRLLADGANFQNCFYAHAVTITAPGHATILSGVNAREHGIIANEWLDPKTLIQGNAVEDVDSPLVGLVMRPGMVVTPKMGRSPRNFLGTTVGDRLKATYGSAAKVFGVADKDRSSILMSGPKADGAYWGEDGVFVTSTYYRRELPRWVKDFNAAHPPEADFGRVWERLLDPAIYDKVQGPDDATGEYVGGGFTRTFPKKIDGGKPEISNLFYWALDYAPWNNDLVEEMAERLVLEEKLGVDDVPDLLCVGFSQTDRIGHNYGPDSHEVMDSYLRLDRTLARLLGFLDQHFRGEYLLVLTADHGATPIPEQTLEKRGPGAAGRLSADDVDKPLRAGLAAALGEPPADSYWALRDGSNFRLNRVALAAKQIDPATAARALRDVLLKIPGIGEAWTREELLGTAPLDAFGERMRRSFNAERSGDVVFILKPYWLGGVVPTGHGSPYDWDSHVPLLWLGAGIQPGTHPEPVHTEDLAPTLARLLGVDLPAAKGKTLLE